MGATVRPIGLVAGSGALAGADVFRKIMEGAALLYGASEDDEYPRVVVSSRGIPEFGNLAEVSDRSVRYIQGDISFLEESGAEVIGIACNTAHVDFSKYSTKGRAKLINLSVEVVQSLDADQTYLVLASRTTTRSGLYQGLLRSAGIKYVAVGPDLQSRVDQVISDVIAFRIEEASRGLKSVADEAMCDNIIFGCTEFPLASSLLHDFNVIDSNEVLARSLLREWHSK